MFCDGPVNRKAPYYVHDTGSASEKYFEKLGQSKTKYRTRHQS